MLEPVPELTPKDITSNPLNRKTPLTIEEISDIRSEVAFNGLKGREYHVADATVSVYQKPISADAFQDEAHREEVVTLLKNKENGEDFMCERLVVNALIEQLRIAEKFELPRDGLFLHLKSDYLSRGSNITDADGELHMRALAKHIDVLRKQGAIDKEIITELSGHLFHEAIHGGEGGLNAALLGGRASLGEITPVTAQMAYYFEEGYLGPTSYDPRRYQNGLGKIESGENNTRDYNIATCVAAEFLLRSLKEDYPEQYIKSGDEDPITACQKIVARLAPEERQKLIPCLKRAIEKSADEKEFYSLVDELKQKKAGQNNDSSSSPSVK